MKRRIVRVEKVKNYYSINIAEKPFLQKERLCFYRVYEAPKRLIVQMLDDSTQRIINSYKLRKLLLKQVKNYKDWR